MAEAFINSATSLLVEELDRLIRSRPDFANSAAVAEKFEEFRHTCTITPSIVGYIATSALPTPATSLHSIPTSLSC